LPTWRGSVLPFLVPGRKSVAVHIAFDAAPAVAAQDAGGGRHPGRDVLNPALA